MIISGWQSFVQKKLGSSKFLFVWIRVQNFVFDQKFDRKTLIFFYRFYILLLIYLCLDSSGTTILCEIKWKTIFSSIFCYFLFFDIFIFLSPFFQRKVYVENLRPSPLLPFLSRYKKRRFINILDAYGRSNLWKFLLTEWILYWIANPI